MNEGYDPFVATKEEDLLEKNPIMQVWMNVKGPQNLDDALVTKQSIETLDKVDIRALASKKNVSNAVQLSDEELLLSGVDRLAVKNLISELKTQNRELDQKINLLEKVLKDSGHFDL